MVGTPIDETYPVIGYGRYAMGMLTGFDTGRVLPGTQQR